METTVQALSPSEMSPSLSDRQWAASAHFLALLLALMTAWMAGVAGIVGAGIVLSFIVPLVIWLTNKDKADKGWLNDQAKEALNFQITIAIGYAICMVLAVIIIGGLLMPIVWLVNLIFCILAGMKANEGVAYRYPFALRLIK